VNRDTIGALTVAIAALAASTATAAPVTRDDFHLTNTANLIALCSATDSDPFYTAARNFCHGFTVGTYRVVATEEAASKSRHKLFCMPANMPSRDQTIESFVQWASERPKTLAGSPTDGIIEYLSTTYPCK
jgi:hypothetical protein